MYYKKFLLPFRPVVFPETPIREIPLVNLLPAYNYLEQELLLINGEAYSLGISDPVRTKEGEELLIMKETDILGIVES